MRELLNEQEISRTLLLFTTRKVIPCKLWSLQTIVLSEVWCHWYLVCAMAW